MTMFEELKQVPEMPGAGLDALPDEVAGGGQPVVIRGAVANWPFVRAARESDEAAVHYLLRFYTGRPVGVMVAPKSEQGRFFYRPDSKEMNFERSRESLAGVLQGLLQQRAEEQPFGIAVQAIPAPEILPGLQEDNPNPFVPDVTFDLQHAKQRAHCRIARRIGQTFKNFESRGLSIAIEDVHDLPLTAAQGGV